MVEHSPCAEGGRHRFLRAALAPWMSCLNFPPGLDFDAAMHVRRPRCAKHAPTVVPLLKRDVRRVQRAPAKGEEAARGVSVPQTTFRYERGRPTIKLPFAVLRPARRGVSQQMAVLRCLAHDRPACACCRDAGSDGEEFAVAANSGITRTGISTSRGRGGCVCSIWLGPVLGAKSTSGVSRTSAPRYPPLPAYT